MNICKNKKCSTELVDGSQFCHLCGKRQVEPENKKRTKRANGTGSVYKTPSGWVACAVKYYHTKDGKLRPKRVYKTGLKTKTEAINYIPKLNEKPDKKKTTLNDYWNVYEKGELLKISKTKQTSYKIAHGKLTDVLHVPIGELTIGNLQNIVDEKSSSYYTARDMKTVLSHLYKRACAHGDVVSNIAQYIALPELVEKDSEPFTKDEQNAFWKLFAENDEFVPYVLLMIYTGMMPGELLDATKDSVNFNEQMIVGIGKKTKKRKVTPIVIPDIAVPILSRIFELSKGDKLLHINKDKFYIEYYACLDRANAKKKPPYSCRHTTGTSLGTSDIPIAITKELMRHSKLSSTQKYIHVNAEAMLDAANRAGEKAKLSLEN